MSDPSFDRELIQAHVEMIHRLATGIDGELVLACYGQDPLRRDMKTGKWGADVHSRVDRFRIGDVDGMVKTVLGWDGVAHANVYMPLHVVRRGLGRNKRGKEGDIVAVLGLVADLDADTNKAGELPIEPSLIVETSPGNFQPFVLFDRPVALAEAVPLAKALQAATGGDSGTGDVCHVWRVPGTLNWPNAKKVHERSRPTEPAPVRIAKPWDGALVTVDRVRDALQPWAGAKGSTSSSGATSGSTNVAEIMARLPKKTQYDIKAVPPAGEDRSPHCMRAILSMVHAGLTDDEIKIVAAAYPNGLFGRYQEGHDLAGELRRARERVGKRKAASGDRGDNAQLVTEDEAALRFAELYAGRLRYCHDHGAWFEWNGSIWRKNCTGIAFHWARELARKIAADGPDKTKIIASKAAFAASVERFARADPVLAITSERWDQDPFLLGTPGGTVDLRTGILRGADPADGVTKSTAVTPADVAHCPLWLKFLTETTGGDVEMIRFMQQWCGYSLTGDTREHALVFVFGDGGNGKSVFVNVIVGVLADYATTAAMDVFIASHGDRHPTDLAMLRGARLVTASETEEGRQWAESRIKQLTGGDRITARFMRQDFFTFLPSFKLTIIGNHKPGLRSVDDAARRRFNLVPFTRKPANPDRELEAKLCAEWPGILRWMIEGCLDWQANGLVRPKAITEATQAYFDDQDMIGEWLEEKCNVDRYNTNKKATTAELFESWTKFAKANNDVIGTIRSFSQNLEKRGFTPVKHVPTGIGNTRARGFSGIALPVNPITAAPLDR